LLLRKRIQLLLSPLQQAEGRTELTRRHLQLLPAVLAAQHDWLHNVLPGGGAEQLSDNNVVGEIVLHNAVALVRRQGKHIAERCVAQKQVTGDLQQPRRDAAVGACSWL
jgi:hypothetical protein